MSEVIESQIRVLRIHVWVRVEENPSHDVSLGLECIKAGLLALVLVCEASGVSLHVQSQVVGAGEGSLTQQTLIGLLPRVLTVVTRELI